MVVGCLYDVFFIMAYSLHFYVINLPVLWVDDFGTSLDLSTSCCLTLTVYIYT